MIVTEKEVPWPAYLIPYNSGGDILLLVGRPDPFSKANLIPFQMFTDYAHELRDEGFNFTLHNLVGNLAVFTPLGFFPVLLWRGGHWQRSALIGFSTSFWILVVPVLAPCCTPV